MTIPACVFTGGGSGGGVVPPGPPNEDAQSVLYPVAFEMPAELSIQTGMMQVGVSFTKPNQLAWSRAIVYTSANVGGPYVTTINQQSSIGGITGSISTVNPNVTPPDLAILLGGDATLYSFATMDDMVADPTGKNMMFVQCPPDYYGNPRNIFLRYQTATLGAPRMWWLANWIYDLLGDINLNIPGILAVSQSIAILDFIPVTIVLPDTWIGNTLYVKIASVNNIGVQQDLSTITPLEVPIVGLYYKPLAPQYLSINGQEENAGIIYWDYGWSGDLVMTWYTRNRFNSGGYDLSRTNNIGRDPDFVRYRIEIYNYAESLINTYYLYLHIHQFPGDETWIYTYADRMADVTTVPFKVKIYQEDAQGVSDPLSVWVEYPTGG